MVRTVMYIFLLFVIIWNINATFHIFSFDPNTTDVDSELYCHPIVYHFSYVLILVFDIIVGIAVGIWILAIIAGRSYQKGLLNRN